MFKLKVKIGYFKLNLIINKLGIMWNFISNLNFLRILSLIQEVTFIAHHFILYEIYVVINVLSRVIAHKKTLGKASQVIYSVIQSQKLS